MGGYGSGRRSRAFSHGLTDDCRVLDAFRWAREGILRAGRIAKGVWQWNGGKGAAMAFRVDANSCVAPFAELSYTLTLTGKGIEYRVPLQTTVPYFGGLKWWFTCPMARNESYCGRRARKLYLPPGCKYFGCRRCYELKHSSQRNDRPTRILYRVQDLRARLGGSRSLVEDFPEKPKGMWWSTYERLRSESTDAELEAWLLALDR